MCAMCALLGKAYRAVGGGQTRAWGVNATRCARGDTGASAWACASNTIDTHGL
jgi:hypothetical protein